MEVPPGFRRQLIHQKSKLCPLNFANSCPSHQLFTVLIKWQRTMSRRRDILKEMLMLEKEWIYVRSKLGITMEVMMRSNSGDEIAQNDKTDKRKRKRKEVKDLRFEALDYLGTHSKRKECKKK